MTSDAPKAARETLDQAVRDYAAACDDSADELGAFMTTGWVLMVAGVRASFNSDDGTSYIKESMAGQSWHAGLGLWAYGYDQTRFNSVSDHPDDPS